MLAITRSYAVSATSEPPETALASVPAEREGSVLFGALLHFAPSIALFVAGCATDFAAVPSIASFFVASSLASAALLWAEAKTPTVVLAPASLGEKVKGLAHAFGVAVGIGTAVVVAGYWALRQVVTFQSHLPPWLLVVLGVVVSDFLYYGLHRLLNHGRATGPVVSWFKRNHALHHSVGELDFFRGIISSVADTGIVGFQLPVLIAAAVLGMDLPQTLAAYALLLLLEGVHHANHAVNIGPLKYVFLDNHAHQMHHCIRGNLVNHGVIFSVWDRMFGTYYEDRSLSPAYMVKHRVALPIVPYHRAQERRVAA
jgi:sterol desaturase/sphingolipid hydroxylase (fatty acid hydroxylase superfamily)